MKKENKIMQNDKRAILKFLLLISTLILFGLLVTKTNLLNVLREKINLFWGGVISLVIGIITLIYTNIVDHSKSVMASYFRGYGSGIGFIILGLILIFKSCGLDKMLQQ